MRIKTIQISRLAYATWGPLPNWTWFGLQMTGIKTLEASRQSASGEKEYFAEIGKFELAVGHVDCVRMEI